MPIRIDSDGPLQLIWSEKGMNIEQVMKLMGHAKVETTMIYVTVKETNVRETYRRVRAG